MGLVISISNKVPGGARAVGGGPHLVNRKPWLHIRSHLWSFLMSLVWDENWPLAVPEAHWMVQDAGRFGDCFCCSAT